MNKEKLMTFKDLTKIEPKLIKYKNNYYYEKFDYWSGHNIYIISFYTIPEEHIDTDFYILLNKGIVKRIYMVKLEEVIHKVELSQYSLFYLRNIVETFFKMYLEQRSIEQNQELKTEQLKDFERWDGVIETI